MAISLSMGNVVKFYDQNGLRVQVFDDASFHFHKGNSYAIVGKSGSGKSTAIHLLAGIDRPNLGQILFDGKPIQSFSQAQSSLFFQKNISLVFQHVALIAELTVLENVMLKAIIAGVVTAESYKHAHSLLAEVGLYDKMHAYPAMLSGGQQQRVALLRAIFIVPDFLLADEPTGNLDDVTSNQIMDLIFRYHDLYGMGLIMSTHDQSIASRMKHTVKVEDKQLIMI